MKQQDYIPYIQEYPCNTSFSIRKKISAAQKKDKGRGEKGKEPLIWRHLSKSVLIFLLTNSGFFRHQIVCCNDSLNNLYHAIKF